MPRKLRNPSPTPTIKMAVAEVITHLCWLENHESWVILREWCDLMVAGRYAEIPEEARQEMIAAIRSFAPRREGYSIVRQELIDALTGVVALKEAC